MVLDFIEYVKTTFGIELSIDESRKQTFEELFHIKVEG